MKTEEIDVKELITEILIDLQVACFKNQIVDTIFHNPVGLSTLYDYLLTVGKFTQEEFDNLTEEAMRIAGLLEEE